MFAFIILCSLFVFNAGFNMDEINSIYYDIDIIGTPIRKGKFDNDMLMMVNKLGQEYACSLPPLPADLKGLGSRDDHSTQEDSVDISELLKPMEAAPCLVTTKDWWTYEFCYGHVIKQYHLEDSKNAGPEMILGKYSSEYDWSSGGRGGADASASRNSNRLQRFHSQYYTNGTRCDLTGEPRRAEVRFKCESDVGDYIERVDEPESCRYIVTVATTRVCHHPYLRPHPSRTPHHIKCSPVLEDDKYTEYSIMQERIQKVTRKKVDAANSQKPQVKSEITKGEDDDDEENIKIGIASLEDSLKDAEPLLKVVEKGNQEQPESTEPASKKGAGEWVASKEGAWVGSVAEVPVTSEDEEVEVVMELEDDDQLRRDDEEKAQEAGVASEHRTSLDRIVDELNKRTNKVADDDLGSNLLKVRNQLNENTAELQQLLEETLGELDRELAALSKLAVTKGERGKLHLWQTLQDKVKNMKDKHKAARERKEVEPERGTLEWLQWRLKKNEKVITKAQETLGSTGDVKKLPQPDEDDTVKGNSKTGASPDEGSAEEVKVKDRDEDEDYFSLFSGQFVDEILKQYMADQDAGSKESEINADSNKNKKSDDAVSEEDNTVAISSLQQNIKKKLKLSGLDPAKHKIEVKILTPQGLLDYGTDGGAGDTLSPQQAHNVETFVVRLMGAHKEEILEKEKHENMNDNYHFSFDEWADEQRDASPAGGGDPSEGDDVNNIEGRSSSSSSNSADDSQSASGNVDVKEVDSGSNIKEVEDNVKDSVDII